MVSTLSEQIKSHATKVTVEPVALKNALANPVLNGKDRDLLQVHLVGVPTYAQSRDLIDLADKIGRS